MNQNIYSQHPNTGPSGIQMVIFQTLFGSGYQMVRFSNGRFYNICPDFSIDCFGMNKIYFYDPY
jgi:hypothetical protein